MVEVDVVDLKVPNILFRLTSDSFVRQIVLELLNNSSFSMFKTQLETFDDEELVEKAKFEWRRGDIIVIKVKCYRRQ